jgi:hypothetical protein
LINIKYKKLCFSIFKVTFSTDRNRQKFSVLFTGRSWRFPDEKKGQGGEGEANEAAHLPPEAAGGQEEG